MDRMVEFAEQENQQGGLQKCWGSGISFGFYNLLKMGICFKCYIVVSFLVVIFNCVMLLELGLLA